MKEANPSIVITRRKNPFACIDKAMLADAGLSWKAKGMLSYLLSKPEDWKPHVNDLVNHAKDGRDAVRAALNELREAGYAQLVQLPAERGRFGGSLWKVSDTPIFV